jgi:hypothetical protein
MSCLRTQPPPLYPSWRRMQQRRRPADPCGQSPPLRPPRPLAAAAGRGNSRWKSEGAAQRVKKRWREAAALLKACQKPQNCRAQHTPSRARARTAVSGCGAHLQCCPCCARFLRQLHLLVVLEQEHVLHGCRQYEAVQACSTRQIKRAAQARLPGEQRG